MTDNDFKNIEDIQRILKYLEKGKLDVESWSNVDELKKSILNGNKDQYGQEANVYKRISADDIVLNEPFLKDIEKNHEEFVNTTKSLTNNDEEFVNMTTNSTNNEEFEDMTRI